MPERIVDVLEAVDVDEHGGDMAGAATLVGDGVGEQGEDLAAVGEPGERIVAGAVTEPGGLVAADGHVVRDDPDVSADRRDGSVVLCTTTVAR